MSAYTDTSKYWQDSAACRGPQAIVFYPPTGGEEREDREQREKRAKTICASCVVSAECLDFAITIREPHGVWGGYTEAERKSLIRVNA